MARGQTVNELAAAGGDTSPATQAENAARLQAIQEYSDKVVSTYAQLDVLRAAAHAEAATTEAACASPGLSAQPKQLNPNKLLESVPPSES